MSTSTTVSNLLIKTHNLSEGKTFTNNDAGKTYFLDNANGFTLTLPKPSSGMTLKFYVKTAPTSGDYLIRTTSDAAILNGKAITSNVTASTDADSGTGESAIAFIAGVSVKGDAMELVSDGSQWYYYALCSVYNAVGNVSSSLSTSTSPSASSSRSSSLSTSGSPSRSSSISLSQSPSTSSSASSSVSRSTSSSASSSLSSSLSTSASNSLSSSVSSSVSPSAS